MQRLRRFARYAGNEKFETTKKKKGTAEEALHKMTTKKLELTISILRVRNNKLLLLSLAFIYASDYVLSHLPLPIRETRIICTNF